MKREKAAQNTRRQILQAAYQEIHRHGFHKTSLDTILTTTGLTKGALYHHFHNKKELGYAVVEEILQESVNQVWLKWFDDSDDPLSALRESIENIGEMIDYDEVMFGCPLNNLCQEMASVDEGFRQRINNVYEIWRQTIARALQKGQISKTVRRDIDANATAAFVVAALAGSRSIAKSSQSLELLKACAGTLITFLETLRP